MLNTKSSQFSTHYFSSKIAFCISVRQGFMGYFLQLISFKMTMVCKASIFAPFASSWFIFRVMPKEKSWTA